MRLISVLGKHGEGPREQVVLGGLGVSSPCSLQLRRGRSHAARRSGRRRTRRGHVNSSSRTPANGDVSVATRKRERGPERSHRLRARPAPTSDEARVASTAPSVARRSPRYSSSPAAARRPRARSGRVPVQGDDPAEKSVSHVLEPGRSNSAERSSGPGTVDAGGEVVRLPPGSTRPATARGRRTRAGRTAAGCLADG